MTEPTTLTFVKGDDPSYHTVWVVSPDKPARGHRLNVAHDLPHLAVESALQIEDGLWGVLVSEGAYPGLTVEHLVAKSLTNAIWGAARLGTSTIAGVRRVLASFARPVEARASHDAEASERCAKAIDDRLHQLDDEAVKAAAELIWSLFAMWDATPAGESLRLEWPLRR